MQPAPVDGVATFPCADDRRLRERRGRSALALYLESAKGARDLEVKHAERRVPAPCARQALSAALKQAAAANEDSVVRDMLAVHALSDAQKNRFAATNGTGVILHALREHVASVRVVETAFELTVELCRCGDDVANAIAQRCLATFVDTTRFARGMAEDAIVQHAALRAFSALATKSRSAALAVVAADVVGIVADNALRAHAANPRVVGAALKLFTAVMDVYPLVGAARFAFVLQKSADFPRESDVQTAVFAFLLKAPKDRSLGGAAPFGGAGGGAASGGAARVGGSVFDFGASKSARVAPRGRGGPRRTVRVRTGRRVSSPTASTILSNDLLDQIAQVIMNATTGKIAREVVLFHLRTLKMKFTGLGDSSEWIPACLGEMRKMSGEEAKSLRVGETVFVQSKPDQRSGLPPGWSHCTVSKESYDKATSFGASKGSYDYKTLEHARGTAADVNMGRGVFWLFETI